MGNVAVAPELAVVQSVCAPPELKLTGALMTAAVRIIRKPVNKAKNMDKSPARKGVDFLEVVSGKWSVVRLL